MEFIYHDMKKRHLELVHHRAIKTSHTSPVSFLDQPTPCCQFRGSACIKRNRPSARYRRALQDKHSTLGLGLVFEDPRQNVPSELAIGGCLDDKHLRLSDKLAKRIKVRAELKPLTSTSILAVPKLVTFSKIRADTDVNKQPTI